MPLPAQRKIQAVREVLRNRRPVLEVARDLGVAKKTIYSWIKRYQETSPRNKSKAFESRYVSGKSHPRAIAPDARQALIRLIIYHPEWGSRKYSAKLKQRGVNLGYVGVHNLLKSLDASTPELRKIFRKQWSGPGRLLPEIKLGIVKNALEDGANISEIAKQHRIARKTIYKWKEQYQIALQEGIVGVQALAENYAQGEEHPRALYPKLQDRVLKIVSKRPKLTIHQIADLVPASSWTVWKILNRRNLSRYQQRARYAASSRGQAGEVFPVRPELSWFGRIRQVFEQFLPGRAPAPPPAPFTVWLRQVLDSTWLKRLAPYLFFLLFVTFGLFSWGRLLGSAESTGQGIGFFFASIALSMGTLFFLYSLKYYFTLAVVLSFSREETDSSGASTELSRMSSPMDRSQKVPFWARLFGIGPKEEDFGRGLPPSAKASVGGLEPDLSQVELERKPFISIHIPMYNERHVAERILKACTSFDYPHFEIVVADDSTDETTAIVQRFAKEWNSAHKSGARIQVIHRETREGFKGGALRQALSVTDPKAEFVVVFDADFVPYPDTLELFLKYFQVNTGSLDPQRYTKNPVAAIQGYQWHVLNKSENWITRGVRSEYAGSYVIERSGEELYGGLKQIAGSVYMIRRDLLDRFGWGTSLTEDFELTLKLYEAGYKVVYTPYIQAPAECASTLKRLVRQRMRWAEGHSFNIKKMFVRLLESSTLTLPEKLEFLYLSPYYLQAAFFLIGTVSWLISETIFAARLPFWTTVWGWSLVLTNMLSLPLMNTVGLFLEEAEERDFAGILSFILLSYILVPFQAYASVKGFLESEEGPWFRTPKTGLITDVLTRGRFYRFIRGIFPGRLQPLVAKRFATMGLTRMDPVNAPAYAFSRSANNQFNSFGIKPRKARWIGKLSVVIVLVFSLLIGNFVPLGSLGSASIEDKWLTTGESGEATIADGLTLKPVKTTFLSNEGPQFNLEVERDKISSKFKGLGPRKVEAADFSEGVQVETNVFYQGKRVDIPTEVTKDKQGGYDIRLIPSQTFKPGRYTLQTTVIGGEGVYQGSQDFNWGVLAINTNKSTYLPDETVQLSLAVLDDKGEMVCNADLELRIMNHELGRDDRLSTEDGSITVNQECHTKGFTLKPDYAAVYQATDVGVYKMDLEAKTVNGTYSISDSFEVRETVAFDIERVAPTRIYPPATYPVKLTIKANEDFNGQVTEIVPESFNISPDSRFRIQDSRIIWNVDWEKGKTYELTYEFDAPNNSPQFYLLGPLEIGSFQETRRWQIAADATNFYYTAPVADDSTTGTWVGVTNCTLDFTPGSTSENWLVMATGQVRHSQTSEPQAANVRLRVEATVEAEAGVQNDPADAETGFFMMHRITGTTAEQNIDVQMQDPLTGTTTVEQCSITAFLIPSDADFQWTEVDGSSGNCLDTPDTTILTHQFTPSSAGDYLFIVSHVSFENPGSTSNRSWIDYPISSTDAPEFNSEDAWVNARDPRQSYVSMREETLGASQQTLTIVCDGSTSDSTMLWAKAASFRMDSFDNDYHDEDLAELTGITDSTWATRSTVTQSAPASSSEFIMLGTISGCNSSSSAGQHGLRFLEDSTVQGDSVWGVTRSCSYSAGFHNSFQWVEPYTTASSKTWDNEYQSTDGVTESRFAESAIHVLQFPSQSQFEQSAYRWFENDNATTVTTALAAQDAAATLGAANDAFRLRAMIHVGSLQLDTSDENFDLQFAERSGTCDTDFSGESYADVTTSSLIKYNDDVGQSPNDGDNLTENATLDPDHGSDTTVAQDYEEANNFTNSVAAIPAGQDGMWDFALIDNNAGEKTFCFRIVVDTGSAQLDTYTVIPEITTVPENEWILFGSLPFLWLAFSRFRKKRAVLATSQ